MVWLGWRAFQSRDGGGIFGCALNFIQVLGAGICAEVESSVRIMGGRPRHYEVTPERGLAFVDPMAQSKGR